MIRSADPSCSLVGTSLLLHGHLVVTGGRSVAARATKPLNFKINGINVITIITTKSILISNELVVDLV